MKRALGFSVNHPWWVIGVVLCATTFFLTKIPQMKIDPRVEVVLKQNNPVEAVYNRSRQEFELYADILIGMLHDNIYKINSDISPGNSAEKGENHGNGVPHPQGNPGCSNREGKCDKISQESY